VRVLISAYACEPDAGSEPGIGWNWVCQIARFAEVWVLTRSNNRLSIEAARSERMPPGVRFIYLDLPIPIQVVKKRYRIVRLYYYLWQMKAYFVARRLHRQFRFHVVHHVTFGTYWLPSFLSLLPVPFVWGPVGGGESSPRGLRHSFSLTAITYEIRRDCARLWGKLDPFVRMTARRSSVVWATSEETQKAVRALGRPTVSVLCQVGLPSEEIEYLQTIEVRLNPPFRVFSIGRLLHWKGFELGLEAFWHLRQTSPHVEYWIIGDGPELKRLQRKAANLGIERAITFTGNLPRRRVLELLANVDVLLHPSLHDSGGWVCLEAMAAGRPVICLDRGGPGLMVSHDTGIKVQAISRQQVIQDLAAGLTCLAEDPAFRARMSAQARLHVQNHFTWDQKGNYWRQLSHQFS
jgi:glycosyltransferase involved in cell wall biosynthesis